MLYLDVYPLSADKLIHDLLECTCNACIWIHMYITVILTESDHKYIECLSSISAAFTILYLNNLHAVNYVICKDNWNAFLQLFSVLYSVIPWFHFYCKRGSCFLLKKTPTILKFLNFNGVFLMSIQCSKAYMYS